MEHLTFTHRRLTCWLWRYLRFQCIISKPLIFILFIFGAEHMLLLCQVKPDSFDAISTEAHFNKAHSIVMPGLVSVLCGLSVLVFGTFDPTNNHQARSNQKLQVNLVRHTTTVFNVNRRHSCFVVWRCVLPPPNATGFAMPRDAGWVFLCHQHKGPEMNLKCVNGVCSSCSQGHNLRGQTVNLTLKWNTIPFTGAMRSDRVVFPNISLPSEYDWQHVLAQLSRKTYWASCLCL